MTAPNSLEQADVDRLLRGQGDAMRPPAATRNVDVQVYDFKRPHRISRERQRTMDAMYERLVKSLEGWLRNRQHHARVRRRPGRRRGNPLAAITAMRDVMFVMRGGRVYRHDKP